MAKAEQIVTAFRDVAATKNLSDEVPNSSQVQKTISSIS